MTPFPFKVSYSGFTYLGISITPTISQLAKVSFFPLLDEIRNDLIRRSELSFSWLERIAEYNAQASLPITDDTNSLITE